MGSTGRRNAGLWRAHHIQWKMYWSGRPGGTAGGDAVLYEDCDDNVEAFAGPGQDPGAAFSFGT